MKKFEPRIHKICKEGMSIRERANLDELLQGIEHGDVHYHGEDSYKPAPKEVSYCPRCQDESTFSFYSVQKYQGIRVFDLYNCDRCQDTVAFHVAQLWVDFLEEQRGDSDG